MQKVATASEMQEIDRCAIEVYGIPGLVLMENAGRAVVAVLREKFPDITQKRVIVFSGKGNNGGDGFVIARHLFNLGCSVRVCLVGKRSQLKTDAKINADIAFKLGIPIDEIEQTRAIQHDLRHCHIIIDALFGTGLTKAVEGIYAKLIEEINSAEKYVVAVDIPSGIDSDSGRFIGPHIRANLTVALALPKRSHLLYPSADAMGEVRVADIGIPREAIDKQAIHINRVEEEDIRALFKKRPANTHKGSYGHVLVIAGSKGKCGAAGLTGIAALRIGAGLVTLAVPASCHQALEFNPLETMTISLPETKNGSIDISAKDLLLEQCRGKTAVAIGPGISTEPETVQLLHELIPELECPMVIDADGLNCLALGLLPRLKAPAVLTPHPKEMARIAELTTQEILDNRIEVAFRFATKNSVGLVLKGAGSLMAFPDGSVYINPTGNPGMATGGSGDVLTGMIASLLAQGFDIKSATLAGTYIHGLTGDVYARENSETTLIAGDLLRTLPASLKRILP